MGNPRLLAKKRHWLRIPCNIPSKWKEFKVTRVFRGETFNIEVRNPRDKMKGVRRMVMDGVEIKDQLLRPTGNGKTHNVLVELG